MKYTSMVGDERRKRKNRSVGIKTGAGVKTGIETGTTSNTKAGKTTR